MTPTKELEIIAIAAIGRNTRAICSEQQLIWRIPEDLKRVKSLTLNHPIIMGRKTYESIGHPLPNRTNIVITRNHDLKLEGCIVANSLEEAISKAREKDSEKIFIFGGAEIYKLALPQTTKLLLTIVDSEQDGDAHFPEYENEFILESEEDGGVFEGQPYKWVSLIRK